MDATEAAKPEEISNSNGDTVLTDDSAPIEIIQQDSEPVYIKESTVTESAKAQEEVAEAMEVPEQYYEQQKLEEEVPDEMVHLNEGEVIHEVPITADNVEEEFAKHFTTELPEDKPGPSSSKTIEIEVEECVGPVEEGVEVIEDTEGIVEMPETEEHTMDTVVEEEEEIEYVDQDSATIVDTGREQIIIQESGEVVGEEEVFEIQTYEEDSVESVEYTVKNSDDVLEIYKSSDSIEVVEEPSSSKRSKTSTAKTETKSPKQRKPRRATNEIPRHVMGVDISKPVEPIPNGRPVPKPRLGVKVPYRNLTSQIVSKQEIEAVVMERVRQKQEQENQSASFSRSLTQRLAKKIIPGGGDSKKSQLKKEMEGEEGGDEEQEDDPEVNARPENSSEKINNDSDLLAILEGEGEEMPVLPKEVSTTQEDETNLKALEREIALQQLQELPHQEPKQRIYKGRQSRAPILTPEVVSKPKETPVSSVKPKSVDKPSNTPTPGDKNKENTAQSTSKKETPKKDHNTIDLPTPKKVPIEIEPQVKVNMVLKTYSRKRKISEPKDCTDEDFLAGPKKPVFEEPPIKQENLGGDVYITKSSRVIKKKVIWDPAEAQPRSPKPTPKPTESSKKSQHSETPSKVTKNADKETPSKVTKNVDKETPSKVTKNVDKETPSKVSKNVDKETPSKVTKNVDKNANTEVVVEKKDKTEQPKKFSPAEKKIKTTIQRGTVKSPVKPKKLSEVDKLLMDEGAVKMLYELNKDERSSKSKKDFYSVEKANKDLIKKANMLKNELEQTTANDNPKSLRRKDGFASSPSTIKSAAVAERKISKDSAKSSIHTPPGSPFAHSQSSMLIRRRSSSSISSSDDMEGEEGGSRMRRRLDSVKRSKKAAEEEKESESEDNKGVKSSRAETAKANQYKSFTVKKTGKHMAIDLHYIDEKCYFTEQVLDEITSALNTFAADKDCLVVTLSSSNEAFCLGLDYSSLVVNDEKERKEKAKQLADKVRDFLLCLLQFPKILMACIQGKCVGLGVTMLPLFDMVLASDAATFECPYVKLGCGSEAGFLLSFPYFTNHGLAAELLYAGQSLSADDASRRGLVKLCWPEKFKNEIKSFVNAITKGSKQSLESTKKQLRGAILKDAEKAIKEESQTLVENWISPECQTTFSSL